MIVALIVAVASLLTGFAAFSVTLNISSSASVTPGSVKDCSYAFQDATLYNVAVIQEVVTNLYYMFCMTQFSKEIIPTSASNIESMFAASNARGSIVINHEPSNYYRFLYYNIQNITIKGDCSESFKQMLLNTRNDNYV